MELGWSPSFILKPHSCLDSPLHHPQIYSSSLTTLQIFPENIPQLERESSVSGPASKETSNMADPLFITILNCSVSQQAFPAAVPVSLLTSI